MKKEHLFKANLHTRQLHLFFPVLLIFIITQSFVKTNDTGSAKMNSLTRAQTFVSYIDYLTANYVGITNLAAMFRPVTGIEFYLPITTNFHAQNNINNKAKLLADVTLQIDNYTGTNVDLWLYANAIDTFYYVNIPPNKTEFPLTVPEGTYDIYIWPDEGSPTYHHHAVGCGHYGSGYGGFFIYGVPLNSSCNILVLDY